MLHKDGTVWLNVGDAFTSGNRRYRAPDRKNRARAMGVRPPTPKGLKPKDLIGLPWRLAFMLQEAGWWLRSEVIWHKPNAHPESVRDRPTKAHETMFLLSKSQGLLLRRECHLRSQWAPSAHRLGHSDGAEEAAERLCRRPPCHDAHDAGGAMPGHHQPGKATLSWTPMLVRARHCWPRGSSSASGSGSSSSRPSWI